MELGSTGLAAGPVLCFGFERCVVGEEMMVQDLDDMGDDMGEAAMMIL